MEMIYKMGHLNKIFVLVFELRGMTLIVFLSMKLVFNDF